MVNKETILGKSASIAQHVEDVDGDETFSKKKFCYTCNTGFKQRRDYTDHLVHRNNGRTQRISVGEFKKKSHTICCPSKGKNDLKCIKCAYLYNLFSDCCFTSGDVRGIEAHLRQYPNHDDTSGRRKTFLVRHEGAGSVGKRIFHCSE